MSKKFGQQSFVLDSQPRVLSWGSVVGPMEGKGPLRGNFDLVLEDNLDREDTSWEKTEQKMMQHSLQLALGKANLLPKQLDLYFAGDLLNQIVAANFTARFLQIPFLGLYGACSTMSEGLALGAMSIDGQFAERVGVSASSHHDTAERQLRYPTELGAQRPMTAQWTVTGAGSVVLEHGAQGIRIPQVTIGKIVDYGVGNANDMGTAMAPAAYDTIKMHLQDLKREIMDYDMILTGDLGALGLKMLKKLLQEEGYPSGNVSDCGVMIYGEQQDVHCGGSGCGCSAVVLQYFFDQLQKQKLRRIFFVGTGALLSPTTAFQGESIPCIAHGVVLECT